MKAIISEKGQVTIPKVLRDRLGLRPGQTLDFSERDGVLVATKVQEQDPVDAVYGIAHFDASTDDLMTRLRGKADPS